MAPKIVVSPRGHLLVDDKLCITVRGLEPKSPITFHALLEEDKKKFESYCWFTADSDGKVDLSAQESIRGTYTGVSSMGIFWSMIPCEGQIDGIRLMKKNVDTPFQTEVRVCSGHLSKKELYDKPLLLCSTMIDRWYKSPGVERQEVTEGRIRGSLFLPPGPGPHPAVIDMFGTVGGLTEYRAALLASRGFATLALPYFGYKDLPPLLLEVDLEYFLEAVDWILSLENIIPDGVGVVGTSKGGDIALCLAMFSTKVKAVVNINGCTFPVTFVMKWNGGHFPPVPMDINKFRVVDGKFVIRDSIDFKASDIFPIWKSDAKILNIVGEDDQCAPKECIHILKSLYPPEKTHNCIVVAYDGAGHLIEPPYTPLCSTSYHKSYDMHFLWGGYPEGHAFAQEDSWKRTLQFLHETLSEYMPAAKL